MSGLTDEQFETVCGLAERAATCKMGGVENVNMTSLPGLLEDLLAAARRGLGEGDPPAGSDMRRWISPIEDITPQDGSASKPWKAPSETTGGES